MSEKIEFIAAKDLPIAEGDEVDVLCVENGELKRKEGASLGGGNTEWDAIFVLEGGSSVGSSSPVMATGTYETLKAKIDAGEVPRAYVSWKRVYSGVTYHERAIVVQVSYSAADSGDIYVYFYNRDVDRMSHIRVAPDGSIRE